MPTMGIWPTGDHYCLEVQMLASESKVCGSRAWHSRSPFTYLLARSFTPYVLYKHFQVRVMIFAAAGVPYQSSTLPWLIVAKCVIACSIFSHQLDATNLMRS